LALAWLLLAFPAQASEFKSYRRHDPAAFAEGLHAYDAGNYAEAYRIWLPLAQRQDPAAMRNVAQLLRRGLGVPQDLKRAMIFYKRAAGFGLAGAQANLAQMYYEGAGTKRNPREAARWFLAAARQGHVLSQFALGQMLETGDGVPLNLKAAQVFYSVAAKAGYEPAAQRLAALDGTLAISPPAAPGAVVAASSGSRIPSPRPRPDDAAAVAAAFLLRGPLNEDTDALEMAPDELWTLRAGFSESHQVATLLGLPEDSLVSGGGPDGSPGEACSAPANPFDRRPAMCRMPPVAD
jgi:TPR repeat protein